MASSELFSLFNQFPSLSILSIFSFFLLGLMRVVPIVILAPFLGAKLPGGVKIGLAISITVILLPSIILTSKNPVQLDAHFIELSLKELIIGLMIGFLATIPFYIAETSGILIDHMRGSASIMALDPLMQTQVSPLGILYNYVLIVLFFQVNGPYLFIDAVLQSYTVIPADGYFHTAFFQLSQPFWQLASSLLTRILTSAIQLAAPSLVGIIMADMFLGIANRLAPQVQIAFLGISIKSILGLGLLCVAWIYILKQLSIQSLDWIREVLKVIYTF